jgi:NAD+ synthase (glutamine-hydrolysing)
MKLIRFGAAVLNQTPLDWAGNEARIRAAIARAKAADVTVLCLPELCIPGYGCEDAYHAPSLLEQSFDSLEELAGETAGMVVSFGLPVRYRNSVFNCACLVADRRILGFVAKRFLAGDGIHYEPRWFKPWQAGRVGLLERGDRTWPIGDLTFSVGGLKIGFEICEDAWVAKRPGGDLALKGIDVILNPSASHFAFGKLEVRRRFVVEGSRAFGMTYVYANLVGSASGRAIYDGGALIASGGQEVARGPRFSFAEVGLTHAVCDVDLTRTAQARTASFQPLLGGGEADSVSAPFAWPALGPAREEPQQAPARATKEEELSYALTLALWDYMRKGRCRGFVVSLSGGADSSACSALVRMMAELAVGELGIEEVRSRLAYFGADLDQVTDARTLTGKLLTCVYQATRHSGSVTRNAARSLAEALAATYHELDVEALCRGYVAMIEEAVGRPLTWERDDVALQNIQARVRAPGVWMLANLKGALLISTSNRSEAAVGYATMDGDTAGGLSPIAGIDKAYLRQWLRWLEKTGIPELGPIPALSVVNDQQPTAELRPADKHQTDEGDLMPYPLLDAIERAHIRDKLDPSEVYLSMRVRFPEYSPRDLKLWVNRFFVLWCRNQWKRERYAPSFHLDDENLDPKTWCRFPILSGSYERELQALKEVDG